MRFTLYFYLFLFGSDIHLAKTLGWSLVIYQKTELLAHTTLLRMWVQDMWCIFTSKYITSSLSLTNCRCSFRTSRKGKIDQRNCYWRERGTVWTIEPLILPKFVRDHFLSRIHGLSRGVFAQTSWARSAFCASVYLLWGLSWLCLIIFYLIFWYASETTLVFLSRLSVEMRLLKH